VPATDSPWTSDASRFGLAWTLLIWRESSITKLVSLNIDNQAKLEGAPFFCIGITGTFPGSYFHGSVRSRIAPLKFFRCHRRLGQLQVAVGV